MDISCWVCCVGRAAPKPWLRGVGARPMGLLPETKAAVTPPRSFDMVLITGSRPDGSVAESIGGQGYFWLCSQDHGWLV